MTCSARCAPRGGAVCGLALEPARVAAARLVSAQRSRVLDPMGLEGVETCFGGSFATARAPVRGQGARGVSVAEAQAPLRARGLLRCEAHLEACVGAFLCAARVLRRPRRDMRALARLPADARKPACPVRSRARHVRSGRAARTRRFICGFLRAGGPRPLHPCLPRHRHSSFARLRLRQLQRQRGPRCRCDALSWSFSGATACRPWSCCPAVVVLPMLSSCQPIGILAPSPAPCVHQTLLACGGGWLFLEVRARLPILLDPIVATDPERRGTCSQKRQGEPQLQGD